MRIMKKVMAMVLSVVMMLAMSVSAFADESAAEPVTKYKITAPTSNDHQYEIYQIFTGDYSGGKLTNEKWGANGIGTTGDPVDETTLTNLKNANDKTYTGKIDAIKECVDLNSTAVATISNGSSYEAVAGYYLIKDTTDTTYALYVVQVVGADVTITPKTDQPSFEKKIKDKNDTTGDMSEWQDSADYDIGDQVPFKLEGTVTDNYDDYKTYYFAFHDKEETGLTFDASSVKVYVDNKDITDQTDKYTVNYTTGATQTDGCTFEVVFNNLKKIADVKAGSKIRVEYTSELNNGAVIGSHGNVNSAKLEYSNNPSNTQEGKPENPGETPWDNVIVFTYKVVVDKYAEAVDGEKLAGAGFTLKKVIKGENGEETTSVVETIGAAEGRTSFEFRGLDDGEYILEESTVPAGYNKMTDIRFRVTATHKIEWEGDRDALLEDLTGTKVTGDITFTTSEDNENALATKVVNKQGVTLPSTGGIGTTIFYVIGGIMAAGAAILLIAKKRMEVEK